MNKLYIVRHGQTNWNKKGLMQGLVDTELNDYGISQAKELSSKIDLETIDICICSPLKRTKQTAKLILDNKIKIIYDDLLIERNFGDYEGEKIDMDIIFNQWDYKLNDKSNNIESIKECLNRANEFLNKLTNTYENKTILIVSHGSFIKALHYNLVGYDENTDFLSFSPGNGEIYEYNIK